ncbi:diguanylate cyclase domain-containing protein [Actinoplanes sp. CA-252034]|uniref:diguanylate cyclase domain-containing protein n=1 Tax=Actinoplanes sp. CA-252034 TaxID=3239906 RepID=UPI003D97794B
MTRFSGMAVFLAVAAACTVAMPLTPGAGRHWIFLLIAVLDAAAVTHLVSRVPRADRTPIVQLGLGVAWLVVNSLLAVFGGSRLVVLADVVLAISNLHLLAAATTLVLRRGRNDVGGLIDAAVTGTVIAALTWTLLLQPRLDTAGIPLLQQVNLLASVLLLSGVLGALIRVVRIASPRPAPLVMFAAAVVCDLAGYVAVIDATGAVTAPTTALREMLFMLGYILLGLAVLHPGAPLIARPGPVPPDHLHTARVVALTAAVTVVPTVTGVREILGIRGDAALLTVGNLVIVGLVAFRIARLGRQRDEAERRLRHQATHDQLTGLPNRAELWRHLDTALAAEQRAGRPSVVLLFCDLNGFKQVNDRLGHLAGDQLLTEVAARLRIPGAVTARYGGDEFVLLCDDPDQAAAAHRLTAALHAALDPPITVAGEQVRIGASIGAVLSDTTRDADDLIRHADQAMYREKAARRAA